MALQEKLGATVAERPGKTTQSIIAKLRRQTIKLSQIRDIAGGRVVVADLSAQERAGDRIRQSYPRAQCIDRRKTPVIGYHALHFVIRSDAKAYELQIRTIGQQRWAQLSEKFADLVGFEIKYGGGPENVRTVLTLLGELIYQVEQIKKAYMDVRTTQHALAPVHPDVVKTHSDTEIEAELAEYDHQLDALFERVQSVIPLFEAGTT